MDEYGAEPTFENIGGIDATIRFVAGPLLIALAGYGIHRLDPHWILSMIHPVILGVYLMLTAAIRIDLFYHAVGWTTMGARDAERYHVPQRAGRRTL